MAFAERVALVTGGASGIGQALAAELCRQGARVLISDVNPAVADVAAGLQGPLPAEGAVVDVTDAAAVEAWIAGACEAHGRIDYLFNNAGIAVIGEARVQTLEDWNRVLDVNVRGVVHGVVAAYPRMIAQGSGHIVNIASLAGLAPAPFFVPYAATKHAVVGLSTSLRAEARALGVRVSAACPGFIRTSIAQNSRFVRLDRDRAQARVDALSVTADACARTILRGVRRNKALIVVTGHARFLHGVYRLAPWLLRWRMQRDVARFRRFRTEA